MELFGRLDTIVPEHAILASNTSSLPIMEIARATHRPDRVIGTHFFNPAPVMKLLEVVRTIATSDQTLHETRALGEKLGKRVIVAQDRGGFIVNLLLIPFLNNAVRLYESGFATRDDIDEGMRLGCGHPMGPLQLLDYIGLDTALFVCDALYEEYAIRDYAAPPLLKRMVAAGYLGRKSGRGFYRLRGRTSSASQAGGGPPGAASGDCCSSTWRRTVVSSAPSRQNSAAYSPGSPRVGCSTVTVDTLTSPAPVGGGPADSKRIVVGGSTSLPRLSTKRSSTTCT